MSKDEAIEVLSDIRAENNLFGDEIEATRYHALSWAISAMKSTKGKMGEQWDELKETIIELRDNNGTCTQQEVCQFLINLMNVLEAEAQIEPERKKGR